jgi:hypothetical protein
VIIGEGLNSVGSGGSEVVCGGILVEEMENQWGVWGIGIPNTGVDGGLGGLRNDDSEVYRESGTTDHELGGSEDGFLRS